MIVIYYHDSWSSIMMTIVFFDYCDNSRHGIECIFIVVYKA